MTSWGTAGGSVPVIGDEQAYQMRRDVRQQRVHSMQVRAYAVAICAQRVRDGVKVQDLARTAQVVQRRVFFMRENGAELVHAGEHHHGDRMASSCEGNHVRAGLEAEERESAEHQQHTILSHRTCPRTVHNMPPFASTACAPSSTMFARAIMANTALSVMHVVCKPSFAS